MIRQYSTTAALLLAIVFAVPQSGDAADPPTDREQLAIAEEQLAAGQPRDALRTCDAILKGDKAPSSAYQLRGMAQFKLGAVHESVLDYQKYCELVPSAAASHWQLGISLYYDGQFDLGQKQFDAYQKFDNNDVENAVWKFLCQTRAEGVEAARKSILKIKNDRRVPMREIYDLYAGQLEPGDVLKAVTSGEPSAAELKSRNFYAHLYLGLYYEALGKPEPAAENINLAAEKYRISHYMGDVAAVHAQRLKKKETPK